MDSTAKAWDASAALADVAWTRELARALVGDVHAADDLAQQAWLIALARERGGAPPQRAWLRGVLRNLIRQRWRDERRRAEREWRAARELAQPSTAELLERLGVQGAVVQAVAELPEPHRTAILLRWFEGLAPSQIAQRVGAPLPTVNSRLARGLELLRQRLDRGHGGRRDTWALVLLRWIERHPAVSAGATLMGLKSLSLVTAAALVALVVYLAFDAPRAPLAPEPPSAASALRSTAASADEAPEATNAPDRAPTPVNAAPATVAQSVDGSGATSIVRGRVVNVDGRALAGVRLRFDGDGAADVLQLSSESDGIFHLAAEGGGSVRTDDARWSTVMYARLRPFRNSASPEPVVVAAPRVELAGLVVDERGERLRGARVELRAPFELRTRIGIILDSAIDATWSCESDADGAFALLDAPDIAGALLVAVHSACEPLVRAAPPGDDRALVLELRRAAQRPEELRGLVLDAGGRPLAGAYVRLDGPDGSANNGAAAAVSVRSDADGRFRVERLPAVEHETLRVAARGYLPVELARPTSGWPAALLVELRQAALTIEGTVVDETGAALVGAVVRRIEGTHFGLAERELGGHTLAFHHDVEDLLDGRGEVATDEHGRFSLPGLLDREYTLQAAHGASFRSGSSVGVRAGARDVELRLAAPAERAAVRGRLVDRVGRPLAGVRLTPLVGTRSTRDGAATALSGEPCTTGADGGFQFASLPLERLAFELGTDERLMPAELRPPPGFDPQALELVASLRCHVQLEFDGPIDAGRRLELDVLDANGQSLRVLEERGAFTLFSTILRVSEGRSQVFAVGDGAALGVLREGGRELARFEFDAAPGAIARVKLRAP